MRIIKVKKDASLSDFLDMIENELNSALKHSRLFEISKSVIQEFSSADLQRLGRIESQSSEIDVILTKTYKRVLRDLQKRGSK